MVVGSAALAALKRDDSRMDHHRALALCLQLFVCA
jgi:hypothetical protein